MARCLLILLTVLLSGSAACSHQPSKAAPTGSSIQPVLSRAKREWIGVYTSPEEVGGYSGTALDIKEGYFGKLSHRMTFYSDGNLVVEGTRDIEEPEKSGDVMVDGNKLYVATATGSITHGKASLDAGLERYTRVRVCGRVVLMRDDALELYRRKNELYDYGILIKVSDSDGSLSKLAAAKHESIKVLYQHPANGWQDPFVNGPNVR